MPPSIPLEEYKDLIIGLYQEGKSWRTIGGILRNEYGLQLNANTVRQRCIEWKVELRGRVQLSDSLEQRVKELWADPKARPTDDQELCRKLKAEGFKVTLGGICTLRKRLKLYRRYDERLGRLRPDSELRGRKRHVQKVSYADYVSAQLASSAPVADEESYNRQNDDGAQDGQDGQYQYGNDDDNDDENAQGLATLAAAIQVDANGRSEENIANAKEPETTSAVFQLEDDRSSDEGDDNEDEDEDQEESETSNAGIDQDQGGQPGDDDPVMVDDDESDDGNGPQNKDSGQAIAAAEDHSQEPTQQDEPTPNEWYNNEHPGLTLADLPSPKLPKKCLKPPNRAGPRGLYQKTRDRLAAYAAAFPAEFRSYLPEGQISQPQIPLAAPYSDRERGKDA